MIAGALLISVAAWAGQVGVVVKVDGPSVYLDLGRSSVSIGQRFEVFEESGTLVHPVSGESLGPIERTVGEGSISEVRDRYSVGLLSTGTARIGLKVRAAEPPVSAGSAAAPASAPVSVTAPVWTGPPLDFTVQSVCLAALEGGTRTWVVAAGETKLIAFQPGQEGILSFSFPRGLRLFSAGALDLDGKGRDVLFVSGFGEEEVRTWVLAKEDGKLVEKTRLPWAVRVADLDGKRRALVQTLTDDYDNPLSPIYALTFDGKRYVADSKPLSLGRAWLYGLLQSGDRMLKYNRGNGLESDGGGWEATRPFGRTPRRIQWNGQSFRFPPFYAGDDAVYAAHNLPAFGIMADTLGLYRRAELCRIGRGGEEKCGAPIEGYVADLSAGSAGGISGLWAGVVTQKDSRIVAYSLP